MSFDWNLSSDEENGFDDWANVDLHASLKSANKAESDDESSDNGDDRNDGGFATVSFPSENNEEEDEEEDDGIDWEDAGDNDETGENSGTKLATDTTVAQLKPVTLNMNEPENHQKKESTKRRKKAKRKYIYEHLPPDMQSFLLQLERAHLLSATGHALFASKYCSDDVVLNVAHSLIPLAWSADEIDASSSAPAPTVHDLANFCNFFFSLVNQRRRTAWRGGNGRGRRRRRGTDTENEEQQVPGEALKYRTLEYCGHLSQTGDERYAPRFDPYDKIHLLISMARCVQWTMVFLTDR
jgi:hypothetical protein